MFNSFLIDNKCPDIIFFTETWLSEFDSAVINDVTGNKYYVIHSPRFLIIWVVVLVVVLVFNLKYL